MPRAPRALRSVSIAVATVTAPTRCAIYTRVSTEDQASKEYSSLDAQREMAQAYITSQRQQGWVTLPDRYDDAGYSGATTKRPALQRLLADIAEGKADCVVVYRYDRVSRSLLDFLQLLEFLKQHRVGFVSIGERFDTSTPHGEMALNMVLSVAQCERRIIGQRTKDKMHAARRRGRWTGGRPILGYDAADGKLVANRDEADQVRSIFELFVETPSLILVAAELNRRGSTQKRWSTKQGAVAGGGSWNRVSLRRLLTDPLYVGLQKLGSETFRGEHQAIVSKGLFQQVQRLLSENGTTRRRATPDGTGFILRGLIRCAACDAAMVPSPAKSHGKLYRYYRCHHAERAGHAACPSKMIPADKVEEFVAGEIKRIGADPSLQQATFEQAIAQVKAQRQRLTAERKRSERDLVAARADIERLVGAVSRVTGPAGDAIAAELNKVQEHVHTVEARLSEIDGDLAALKTQEVDRDELARALAEFDPVWDVLLAHERERVMHLLIDRIDYDGAEGQLTVHWRLAGFGQLAGEVAS